MPPHIFLLALRSVVRSDKSRDEWSCKDDIQRRGILGYGGVQIEAETDRSLKLTAASYCSGDTTRDLKYALTRARNGNPRPALIDLDDVRDFMRRIGVYDAKNGGLVRYALKLIALTTMRLGELRLAKWTKFDEENSLWLIL